MLKASISLIILICHAFSIFAAYTMAKYGMSLCVLGMAAEFEEEGVAVNALWPRTGKKILCKSKQC